MNSKQPITEEAEKIIKDIINHIADAYNGGKSGADLEIFAPRITALCRQFAASELRAAAGEDEPGESRYNAERHRNDFRRTLRDRADKLEKKGIHRK